MTVVDAQERLTALDPLRSFCVSAPAGSGKTELLIQRYLALLARVKSPEQVLAITFTRKAAAEMRERVVEALVAASAGGDRGGLHQQQTRELALAALAADDREHWGLVRNISRLNIKTIDSFCSHLTRQMPVLSEFGGPAEIVDNAAELYAEAVEELFGLIDTQSPLRDDLAALMLHFDNDRARLQDLLTSMLARRDQWGSYIGVHHQAEEAEAYLLRTVEGIVVDALGELASRLNPYSEDILALQQYAASNTASDAPLRFPAPVPDDLPLWRGVRSLLLTADKRGKWRAALNVRMGFPPGKGLATERKEQLGRIIAELGEVPGLLEALASVQTLPEIAGSSQSWQLVLQLSHILPRLAAELLLVFARRGQVDHSQVSLSALQALGEDDSPTDLALRLDYQLEHILVDEFQDTAINQYELVRRLTRGWGEHNAQNPQAPRTLMVVGDGMQSIYGFRDANVGLFLKARAEGFNDVSLEPLALRSNFRSDEGVVKWVNATFARAFPQAEDVSRGQIQFTGATAVRPASLKPAVSLRGFTGEDPAAAEVEALCKEVQRGIARTDCESIAILGRTRGHLQPILARLKSLGIDYSAQDIDSLASSTAIMDLLTLCRALSNPADRLAWMALLRAPWCGLPLSDLHVIGGAGEVPAYTPLAGLLVAPELLQRLSGDGRERVTRVALAVARAERRRDRLSLRAWVEGLWLDLGGSMTIADSELADAERFFTLLEQAEIEGRGLRVSWLEHQLQTLYVQAENPASKVQVMTLHRAKGLEFDWVLIPSLEKTTRANAKPLMLWDEYSSIDGERGFLLAADDHSADDEPTLYNWLKVQRGNKEILESTRLLYVGATRAVQRLVLSAGVKYDAKKDECRPPAARSLLAAIWPVFSEQMTLLESSPGTEAAPVENVVRLLHRLPLSATAGNFMPEASPAGRVERGHSSLPRWRENRVDRYVGTVVHLALEQLSRLAELPESVSAGASSRWRKALAGMGLADTALALATARVDSSVTKVLTDPQGRWILSQGHREARSEWALSVCDDSGNAINIILDRTFVDSETGERWLIDYKNSEPGEGEPLAEFARREENAYGPQLRLYRDALSELSGDQVHCALYFTALAHFHRLT